MYKKSTWLSLATAAAVVVTSAVYDKTTVMASAAAVTLRNSVTVENEGDLAKQMDLEISVKGDSGLITSDFTFEVPQSGGGSVSGFGTSFTDTAIEATNTYTIKATVNSENVASKVEADTPIQFEVTATLS